MANNKNKITYWLPVFIWMIIIFMFSAQPATQSNELSVGFTQVLINTLGKIMPFNIESSTINSTLAQLNHIIRKLAHFSIYFILGALVYRALIKSGYDKKTCLVSFLICVAYAISDEFHQLFVPGRGCQAKDVLIDSAGSLIAIVLSKLYYLKRI